MAERQTYYVDMIAYLIEKYHKTKLSASEHAEAPLPNVRVDMLFKVPKQNLFKEKTPFPYLEEVNLFHIKAVNDRLTKEDVIQYLGELYVLSTSTVTKGKTTSLTVISAEKIVKSIFEAVQVSETSNAGIYKVESLVPAYIYVLDELPDVEDYQFFIPFKSSQVIQNSKEFIRKLSYKKEDSEEAALFLFWLRKLQPNFYREIEMPIDMEEVVKELCPNTIRKSELKVGREMIVSFLKSRFGEVPQDVVVKLEKVESLETLKVLSRDAARCSSFDDFKRLLD